LVSAEPSLFSVGGNQSRVATPAVVVVLTGVDATVVPAAGVVVAGVVVVVDPEFEAVDDEAVAVLGVPAVAVPALVGAVTSDERSIVPAFADTKLATEPVPAAADMAAEPLDPSPLPQAARVSVARAHSTTLRMCERAAKVKYVISHYPGKTLKRSARAAIRLANVRHQSRRLRSELRQTLLLAGNPAISCLLQLETGGFASPPYGGFALAL
jgi:hypothetical protein